jgi:hypothetical protein
MIDIGVKVVCIDNRGGNGLVLNKVYVVESYDSTLYYINGYYAWRFITLKEYRKRKLNKIINAL